MDPVELQRVMDQKSLSEGGQYCWSESKRWAPSLRERRLWVKDRTLLLSCPWCGALHSLTGCTLSTEAPLRVVEYLRCPNCRQEFVIVNGAAWPVGSQNGEGF